MEKALVINELGDLCHITGCKFLGCNILNKKDAFKVTQESKNFYEKRVSEKLSSLSGEGYELLDDKIFSHDLYVDNFLDGEGQHGVYRFTRTGSPTNYKAYFGPIITAQSDKIKKKRGCKKFSFKTIGCRSKGGNIQYLNFRDNELNEEVVKKLNKYFKIEKSRYNKEKDDYRYYTITNLIITELLNQNYHQLLEQYKADINQLESEGYSYYKNVSIPSDINMYSQAMIFSDASRRKVTFPNIEDTLAHTTFLHRFDLWYFPRVRGIFRVIIDFLLSILPWVKKKDDDIVGSTIIESQNIKRLEEVYTDDFNNQGENATIEEKIRDMVGAIPVTIAKQRYQSWWQRLWHGKEYDYYTFVIPAVPDK